MRDRTELVAALLECQEGAHSLVEELRIYGWDSDIELVTLMPKHVINVLRQYLSGKLSASQVRDWANAIECREDIGMLPDHKKTLDEMVFWLANPEINFPIDTLLVNRIIENLESNRVA